LCNLQRQRPEHVNGGIGYEGSVCDRFEVIGIELVVSQPVAQVNACRLLGGELPPPVEHYRIKVEVKYGFGSV